MVLFEVYFLFKCFFKLHNESLFEVICGDEFRLTVHLNGFVLKTSMAKAHKVNILCFFYYIPY